MTAHRYYTSTGMRAHMARVARVRDVLDQVQWIDKHGGSEAGYRQTYRPEMGVDAQAIYAADQEQLDKLLDNLNA